MSTDVFALARRSRSPRRSGAQRGARSRDVFYGYVVDARNHLLGVISLRQLLLNSPSTPLKKIMSTTSSGDDSDRPGGVARIVATYNLLAVPVVDDENKLAGIITSTTSST